MNLIEHVWDNLKKNVKCQVLENAIIAAWEQIPQDFIQK